MKRVERRGKAEGEIKRREAGEGKTHRQRERQNKTPGTEQGRFRG